MLQDKCQIYVASSRSSIGRRCQDVKVYQGKIARSSMTMIGNGGNKLGKRDVGSNLSSHRKG